MRELSLEFEFIFFEVKDKIEKKKIRASVIILKIKDLRI
jgi:hypothetical protein